MFPIPSLTRDFLSRRVPAALLALTLALVALLGGLSGVPTAHAADANGNGVDDSLEQTLTANEPVDDTERVIPDGHVDIGPRFEGGQWKLYAHDDALQSPAWRPLTKTVLAGDDSTILNAPKGEEWKFLGVNAGERVWVFPQTQHPGAAWVGWNTQDPEVMKRIDRGMQLTMTKVEGPGEVSVFLQAGDFGKPQVLWSTKGERKPMWVDVNTHTHANWVFTKPGEYVVWLTASAKLLDGSQVTTTQPVRFAVGSSADRAKAMTLARDAAAPAADGGAAGQGQAAGQSATQPDNTLQTVLIVVFVLVALAIIAGVILAVVKGNRARRQAMAEALAAATARAEARKRPDGDE